MTPARRANPEGRMALREHLKELRNRVVKVGLALAAGAVGGWFLANPVLEALAQPIYDLAEASGREVTLNIANVTGALDLKVKAAIFVGFIGTSPLWIYQLWAFITPGLTRRERRYALGFVGASVPLFLGGAYLAYRAMPSFVEFLVGVTPDSFSSFTDAATYYGFVMRVIVGFGLSFLLPVVLVALNFVGLVRGRTMLRQWRWSVVAAFTFAAIATPTPDILSMFLLALPLLALFFLAIGIAILNDRRRGLTAQDRRFDALDDDEASAL